MNPEVSSPATGALDAGSSPVPAAGTGTSNSSRFDRYFLVLLVLPGAMLVWSRNWLFTKPAIWDAWYSLGFWLNLRLYKSDWWPDTYYGSRMPWIITGWSVHQLFEPVAANYILHIAIYLAAILCFYLLARRMTGRRSALVFSIVLGAHPQFLYAVGHDYPDGFGIALNLAGLVLAERAARGSYPRICLALAGAAAVSLFFTNLFLLAFAPFILLFYWSLRFEGWSAATLRRIWPGTLWFLAGAAGWTAVLAAVNYSIDGNPLFYSPSFRFAGFKFGQDDGNTKIGMAWIHKAYWLSLHAAVLAVAVLKTAADAIRRSFRVQDPGAFFAVHLLLTGGAVVAWEMRKGWALEVPYYCSYFLSASFLLLAAYCGGTLEKWTRATYWTLIALLLLVLPLAQGIVGGRHIMPGSAHGVLLEQSFWIVGAMTAAAILLRMVWRRSAFSMAAASGLLCLSLYANTAVAWIERPIPDNEDRLRRVTDAARIMTESTGGERALLWFDEKDPMGDEFIAVDSVLLRYFIGWSFPEIKPQENAKDPAPLSLVGVLSSQSPEWVAAEARKSLRSISLSAETVATHRVQRGAKGFHVILLRVDSLHDRPAAHAVVAGKDRARRLSLVNEGGAPAASAGGCWIEDSPHVDIQTLPGGLRVRTGDGDYGYSARCGPIVATEPGSYRFTLQYRRVKNPVYFGVLSEDGQKWLTQTSPAVRRGSSWSQSATVKMKAGERFQLMLANQGRPFSELVIEKLTISVWLDAPEAKAAPVRKRARSAAR